MLNQCSVVDPVVPQTPSHDWIGVTLPNSFDTFLHSPSDLCVI